MRDEWDQITWCDGFTDLVALQEKALAVAYAEAQAAVDRILIYGTGTGEPRGFLAREVREPTPPERALAILDPELRRCHLYKAGPPTLYPNWKATP
jgi:hypothetical protein